uniref:Organic cation transporter protein-like n=1 Tax=Saccoglossus kowalevskii TaxID=10224 RepID=A0ABM0GXP0_SACKO|nr:PREDICTED: organic cation transporter protein-like [Saccoglossus kowalevskii]
MLQFDDVLEYLREFGLYQKRAYFLLCLVYTLPASHAFAQVFLAAETDHWCYIPELEKYEEDCNVSNTVMFCQDMMKNHSIPSMESSSQCGSGLVYGNCERYENLSYSNDTMKCNHGWRYDRSQYKSTVFQEFDLVCNRYFLAALSSSMFQLGLLVGGVIFGALSDKIGRMPSMMLAVLCMLVAGTACAFSPNIIVYSICRLIIGCGVIGVWLIAFVLATEYVGPSKRVIAGMVVSSFTSIGCTILAVFAYFIRYWWILQLCISIPTAIFLSFWWLIPESPRWLLSVGKYNRANKIIKACAEVNKVTVPDSMYEEMSNDVDDPKPEVDNYIPVTLNSSNAHVLFTVAMVYYGLSLNTSNLGGNDYLNAFLAGAVEVPAYILAIFLPETRLGRRWSQSSTLILGGVACVLTLFTPSSILPASHAFAQVFLAAETDHWCYVPELDKYEHECSLNNTVMFCQDLVKNHSIPSEDSSYQCDNGLVYSNCERYENKTYTNDTIECNHGWKYDRSQYKSTVFQEFDLVCDRYYLGALSSSMYMVGLMVGALVFGALSDKIGRLPALMLAVMCMAFGGTACAFSPNIAVYSFFRLIVGCGGMGMFLVSFVLGTELVGPSKRVFTGIVIEFFFSFGYMLLAGLAYLIRYWWKLQLTLAVPASIFLTFWWILPESPRWLLSVGKNKRAGKIIRDCAKVNKVDVPDSVYKEISQDTVETTKPKDEEEKGNALDLFRMPNMRKKSLNIFYNWFTISMVYYGLSLNTSNLGGNDYLNAFLSGAVEIPAYILALFLPETRFGRRWSLSSTLILGGVACVLTLFTPACELQWIGIALAMTGKFAVSAAFAIVYVFSAEIYPTPVRTIGMGFSSMCARVGGILAPQMILIKTLWEPLPIIIFGATSILAGLLTLLLPETRNQKLPETLMEGERFGKKSKSPDDSNSQNGTNLPKYEHNEMKGIDNRGADVIEKGTKDTNRL